MNSNTFLTLSLLFICTMTGACGYMDQDLFMEDEQYAKSFDLQDQQTITMMGSMHIYGCGGLYLSGFGMSGSGIGLGYPQGVGAAKTNSTVNPHILQRQPTTITGEAIVGDTTDDDKKDTLPTGHQKLMDHATTGQQYFVDQLTQ